MQNDVLLNFSDEGRFFRAITRLKNRGVKISEYHTPNLHSNEAIDKHAQKKIGIIGLCGGVVGAMVSFFLQLYLHQNNYVISMGGVQLAPTSAYMPIVLEGALLFSGIAMFVAYRLSQSKQNDLLSILPDSDQYYILCSTDSEDSIQAVEEVKAEAGSALA